jgi:hypothetical protein
MPKSPMYYDIYLWTKVVCLVLSCWDLPNHGASCRTLGSFRKLLMSRGASTWFETIWRSGLEAIDYWTIFSMKFKSNQNWKLYWNLEAFLVLLEISPWVRFNKIYFTIFRAKMWKILILERILLLEIQTNCKIGFGKEKSVEPSMCSHSGELHVLH